MGVVGNSVHLLLLRKVSAGEILIWVPILARGSQPLPFFSHVSHTTIILHYKILEFSWKLKISYGKTIQGYIQKFPD
jgi:hypothetical protein